MSNEPKSTGYSPFPLSKDQVESLRQSQPADSIETLHIDFLSTRPKNDSTRDEFRQLLQDRFRLKLIDSVERIWELPPIILRRSNDEYLRLLTEARELFTMGYFYSCVAMCGIVGEKLVKDLLRDSILISVNGTAKRPTDEAFDQLERIDASSIVRFLHKAQLLGDDAKKAAQDLAELRNQYAHARGKNPQVDALHSIQKLHALLEGTVSVLKDYEVIGGVLVPKPT